MIEGQQQALAHCKGLIRFIEDGLFAFYRFESQLSAADFLLAESALRRFLEDQNTPLVTSLSTQRAGVWVFRENAQEVFVGVYLQERLILELFRNSPLRKLKQENLDAFCVLVEEVSHFHLLCQRMAQERGISQLELEWQGDVDKALITGDLLQQQAGRPYLRLLASKIYDEGKIISLENASLYEEANRYAGKFWYSAISQGVGEKISLRSKNFMDLLQGNYSSPLEEKFPFASRKKAIA